MLMLSKVIVTQQILRAREVRHPYALKSNNSHLHFGSITYSQFVILGGKIQVVILRFFHI